MIYGIFFKKWMDWCRLILMLYLSSLQISIVQKSKCGNLLAYQPKNIFDSTSLTQKKALERNFMLKYINYMIKNSMYFYAVNMTWSRATCMDKLKQYVHTFFRCHSHTEQIKPVISMDCNFTIEFELMTFHLKTKSAEHIVLTY